MFLWKDKNMQRKVTAGNKATFFIIISFQNYLSNHFFQKKIIDAALFLKIN
jgi:hypothetical protein